MSRSAGRIRKNPRALAAAPDAAGEQLELGIGIEDAPRFSVEYLTIAEAAERVRCHERTIRRAIDSGELMSMEWPRDPSTISVA